MRSFRFFRNISSPVKFATSTSKAFCDAAVAETSSAPSNSGAIFCEFAALSKTASNSLASSMLISLTKFARPAALVKFTSPLEVGTLVKFAAFSASETKLSCVVPIRSSSIATSSIAIFAISSSFIVLSATF